QQSDIWRHKNVAGRVKIALTLLNSLTFSIVGSLCDVSSSIEIFHSMSVKLYQSLTDNPALLRFIFITWLN
ncbi:MAG: hypothetical protein ABS921_13605, partial [Psychrobacter alimentarius]